MQSTEDQRRMREAMQLARRGEGRTRPNPPVGAVVVKGRRLVGKGYHHRAGTAHAEVLALRQAGDRARGATLYVTLEPCSTMGRTPPCTKSILTAGIARVVVAAKDPNPAHAGRGLKRLRAAGVEVTCGVLEQEAESLLAPFRKWITTGLPYFTLKLGMTADGRIADHTGRSRWITGPASRAEVQAMRRRTDAGLVGRLTAEHDDPSLLIPGEPTGRRLRVVVDSHGRLSPRLKVFSDSARQSTILATTSACTAKRVDALARQGVSVLRLPAKHERVSLKSLARRLGQRGVLHVLCEGGGELAAGLIRAGLIDEYIFFLAPTILGADGKAAVGTATWTLGHAPLLDFVDCKRVGGDIMLRAIPRNTRA